jgi:hypothetical protein
MLVQTQADYLREFLRFSPELLGALLARESLKPEAVCPGCSGQMSARWRCKDCTAPEVLCRRCMRISHRRDPLHRLEHWTGKFFRPAAMWEVGGYLEVGHSIEASRCVRQQNHVNLLEELESKKDEADEEALQNAIDKDQDSVAEGSVTVALGSTQDRDNSQRDNGGASAEERHHGEESSGDGEYFGEDVDDEALGLSLEDEDVIESGAAEMISDAPSHSRPREDTLGNKYVRIVHVNGIHYLPLVSCKCHGPGQMHIDLMHARLLPTSFNIIRTLFTVASLDDYRLSNLELKSSAYQYWGRITRITATGGFEEVLSLYRELWRMSREWRLLKKMKWAGFGHEDKDPTNPAAGELAIFCPTCPQPGINLPPDWKRDPNQ